MSTTTVYRRKTMVAEAPTASGSFTGHIEANPMHGDKDHERISSWRNLPTMTPLLYGHAYNDMVGATVGEAFVEQMSDGSLTVKAQLDLEGSPMARAIHERLLLPDDHPQSLGGLSVGFSCSTSWVDPTTKVRVLEDVELLELSIVRHPAQTSRITDIKSTKVGARNSASDLATLQSIHDATIALGATCSTGGPVQVPKSAGSRCTCGAKVFGDWRSIRAVRNGVDYGDLRWRSCGRCGMKELQGSRPLQKADTGDGWARFIRQSERRGESSARRSREYPVAKYVAALDALEIADTRRAAPVQERSRNRSGGREEVWWFTRSLDRMEMVPRG
jgi:HK97 family phage prohead protease